MNRVKRWFAQNIVWYTEVRTYPASLIDNTFMTVAEYTLILADGKVSLTLILGRRRDTIE